MDPRDAERWPVVADNEVWTGTAAVDTGEMPPTA
jgi:hypothetical protein